MPATASSICSTAAQIVGGDRAGSHGDIYDNWQNIADIWNTVLTAKARRDLHPGMPLTPLDALNMMEALKIARRYSGKHNLDDYVDGAGYAGCAGHVAEMMVGSADGPAAPQPTAQSTPDAERSGTPVAPAGEGAVPAPDAAPTGDQ